MTYIDTFNCLFKIEILDQSVIIRYIPKDIVYIRRTVYCYEFTKN